MNATVFERELPADPMEFSDVEEALRKAPAGAVETFDPSITMVGVTFWHLFEPFLPLSLRLVSPDLCGLHSCLWVGPHTDSVIGDITVGLVLQGNHYLFVDDGVEIGNLRPGSLFVLNNKTMHWAFCRDGQEPLVFWQSIWFVTGRMWSAN